MERTPFGSADGLSAQDYLRTPETMRHVELVSSRVREATAPWRDHQDVVLRVGARLDAHVRRLALGWVGIAPIDVVLDSAKGLVLQPDVVFVAAARRKIVRHQVWGAPDLVVEVLSKGSRRFDCRDKLQWYREYGVREYWVVDPRDHLVTIHAFADCSTTRHVAADRLRSRVLTRLRLRAAHVFI